MKTFWCACTLLLISLLAGCSGGAANSNNTSGNSSGNSSGSGSSNPATVSSISVSPNTMSIGMGATQQFSATAHMSDGTTKDVTATAQWNSSDSNIASISAAGLATASTSGTVTINAQSGSFQASASLTVTAAAANLTSIAISPTLSSMAVHTSQQFTATGIYSDGSSADLTNTVAWSSSSTAAATINASGMASAVAAGSTTISASLGSVSQSTTLTVNAPTVVSISVTPVGLTLAIGVNQQFVATATYSDGSSSDLSSGVTWSSSSTSVATIDSNGLCTTVGAGATTVTATFGGLSDSSDITVVAAHLLSIAITGPSGSSSGESVAVGTTSQLSAVGTFDDGSTQLLTPADWSSSNTLVATVDANGLVTAVGPGTATITVTVGGVSQTYTVTVTAATLVSISVTPANSSMSVGTTKQFAATGTFSDASTQDITSTVLWTSSSSAIANINASGLASSVANGSTTIKAVFGSVSGSTGLTVSTAHLVSIAINPANPRIEKGTSIKFTVTGTFSDGSTATNLSGVSWKSSKPNLAQIRSTGIAHGKKAGSVTITASASGIKGTTTLTMGTGTLVSVAVTPNAPTAAAGSTQQFAATGTFSDGSTQDVTLNSHWSSSSASVATIANAPSVAGIAQCNAAGTTTIGANSRGTTGSATLTVQ